MKHKLSEEMKMHHKEFWDKEKKFFIDGAKVSDLHNLLKINAQIMEHSCGFNSLGHKEALEALEMFEQIISYLDCGLIEGVTFKKIHKSLEEETETEVN